MEYLQLTQHILTENKIFERSFEDNCELVLNDLGNFNVSACLNEMNNDFFSFLQYFFNAFKTGIKKKWQTAITITLLIMIIILNTAKSNSINLHLLHIILIVLFQIIIILVRKTIWSFILNQKKISPITSIFKIIFQKLLDYQASSTLKIFIFNPDKFQNKWGYYIITALLVYVIYLKSFFKQWRINNLRNYIGLSCLISMIFCESFISEMIYTGGLAINDELTRTIIDILMEYLVSYIIKPVSD